MAPFAAQAETWNIYGWQNHSWEFVDEKHNNRSYDRIQSNAGNIGFAASMDTGVDGIHVNVQCEQFTYYNHFGGGTGWCNRNSKIGLSHPQAGEIMLATWLLPYNEGVAQWVDPFYDAGADSHTSIMGSVGANTIFYNTGDFDQQASASGPGTGFSGAEFNYAGGGYDTGFNRRQENIIQYWSPNWNGFVFRFAWTAGNRDEMTVEGNKVDPVIRSSSLAYTNGPLWLAVTWQDHEDWTAISVGEMESSDAESFRIAGRYIMDMGDGVSVQISAMWEDLEYEFNGVTSVANAMTAFGYSNATSTIRSQIKAYADAGDTAVGDLIKGEKTIALLRELFPACWGGTDGAPQSGDNDNMCPTNTSDVPAYVAPTKDNPATAADESKDADGNPILGNGATSVLTEGATGTALMTWVSGLATAANGGTAPVAGEAPAKPAADASDATKNAYAAYTRLANAATDNAAQNWGKGANVKIERDAWMVSGKVKFGGPLDFRFSYMDADDLEISCAVGSTGCTDWDDTAADAWNVGVFYTMPGGTELRMTYSEVDNDANGTYGQGISGTGLGAAGAEIEMFAVGIVHWFD